MSIDKETLAAWKADDWREYGLDPVAAEYRIRDLIAALKEAEQERDMARERLSEVLAGYQVYTKDGPNPLTGDLAVDMASWATRNRDRAEKAEAALARVRALVDEWKRSAEMLRRNQSYTSDLAAIEYDARTRELRAALDGE